MIFASNFVYLISEISFTDISSGILNWSAKVQYKRVFLNKFRCNKKSQFLLKLVNIFWRQLSLNLSNTITIPVSLFSFFSLFLSAS